ncbi:MAG TPA: 3-deoxy-D-manno-octulosonic acid transferase [Prosthecochloris aestuarii]|uniref:3-deoxy-D-manno-octulosonic acid transferase n=1 Tax=Prosthecochloris aestuarii TaxID=1102 RepID=A0A831SRN1_PROAE|nr:3-deoxy-D-manno-octulosonic acid transferase [Prosthecochloris aestuarii]
MKAFLFFYNIGFSALHAATRFLSVSSPRLKSFFTVRKGSVQELLQNTSLQAGNDLVIWVHAASVGEFEQARPVINRVRSSGTSCKIVVSFQSPSGYNLRKSCSDADLVVYHPLDTRKNAREFIRHLQPDIVLVMRYDFWVNHLWQARQSGARLILAGAVLQDNSIYLKPCMRWFYQRVFRLFDRIFTVSHHDTRKFHDLLDAGQAITAGDPRYDQVWQRSRSTDVIENLRHNYSGHTVLVAGSTWREDERCLLDVFKKLGNEISLIIVPHETDRKTIHHLESELSSRGIAGSLFSQCGEQYNPEEVLIIDKKGFLAELYSMASIAYVGGGFGINVHNTLEPAVYGIPVIFGPNHHNSPEAEALIEEECATEIRSSADLNVVLRNLIEHPDKRESQGKKAGSFVRERLGTTELIATEILSPGSTG